VQSSDIDAEPRFGMLDTLREYALERLGERREPFARFHARYYGSKVAAAREKLESWDLPRAAESLDPDESNIRAAFDYFIAARDSDAALRLANSLLLYWYLRGRPSEAIMQLRVALAQGARDRRERVRALNNIAVALAMGRADSGEIASAAADAEKAAYEIADECEIAFALNNRALAEAFGNARAALELLEDAAMRAERAKAPWVASMALLNLGWVQLLVGDREGARARPSPKSRRSAQLGGLTRPCTRWRQRTLACSRSKNTDTRTQLSTSNRALLSPARSGSSKSLRRRLKVSSRHWFNSSATKMQLSSQEQRTAHDRPTRSPGYRNTSIRSPSSHGKRCKGVRR
jgi:hypothetical protein